MAKITIEKFEESASKPYYYNGRICGTDYYQLVLRDITKKHVSLFQLRKSSGYEDYTLEETKKIQEFVYGEFMNKYDLTPYGYKIPSGSFGKLKDLSKPIPSLLLGDDAIIRCQNCMGDGKEEVCLPVEFFYTSDSVYFVYNMMNSIIEFCSSLLDQRGKDGTKIDIKYSIATAGENGIDYFNKLVSINKINLQQFNEDLPDEDINKFLRDDRSGILIFHGEPGCGKTSYIKYLISQNGKKMFMYCGLDIIQNSNQFRDLVVSLSEEELVVIVEDCESILRSRNSLGSSNILSDILNISNGLIGDFAKTKFIFTFNTNMRQIDDAILRDGRLACEYEFKPLRGDRLKELAKKLGREISEDDIENGISLADLYNNKAKRSIGRKKVGF